MTAMEKRERKRGGGKEMKKERKRKNERREKNKKVITSFSQVEKEHKNENGTHQFRFPGDYISTSPRPSDQCSKITKRITFR